VALDEVTLLQLHAVAKEQGIPNQAGLDPEFILASLERWEKASV
jgi:hypothetical protein